MQFTRRFRNRPLSARRPERRLQNFRRYESCAVIAAPRVVPLSTSRAQVNTGNLSGQVLDPSGAIVSGAHRNRNGKRYRIPAVDQKRV